jgi:hypothetical protein
MWNNMAVVFSVCDPIHSTVDNRTMPEMDEIIKPSVVSPTSLSGTHHIDFARVPGSTVGDSEWDV